MMLQPISRMKERVRTARDDSDTAFFYDLLLLGELVMKVLAAAIVGGITLDIQRHQYRLLHRLVRADGVGEWSAVLSDATRGPASAHLHEGFRQDQRAITMNVGSGEWQHEATTLIDDVLREFDGSREALPAKVSLQRFFDMFAELRNKTRGHGATRSSACSYASPRLERSIDLLIEHLPVYNRSWAYLHRNLSGKYRVALFGGDPSPFSYLKTTTTESLVDGVYVYADGMHRVELLHTSVDLDDFFVANGAFNDKRFELLSYVSDDRLTLDSTPYLTPIGDLPPSETQGVGTLDVLGNVFTNLPTQPEGYVSRPQLERELTEVLLSERHQMVTLVGKGGVGKTSVALAVLHAISQMEQYEAVIWFSARDIDLLPSGPKLVNASVLNEVDIAREFAQLMAPIEAKEKGYSATKYFAQQLTRSDVGPLLVVFDNFETVRNPKELYTWIDTYIRAPNKVLITTRFREFRGDFDVPVTGMTDDECEQLIWQTSQRLGISSLLTPRYVTELTREADGHPYVVKVLLGEVAKERRLLQVARVIAAQEEILDALFERTYAGLSPAARRVFLLLCSWRSAIPEIALEAILLRPANERMDVRGAIEELRRMSLVELHGSTDGTTFVTVPLAALVFGRRKLSVSPAKAAVEADAQLLYRFGSASESDLKRGVGPRVERFFKVAAGRIARDASALEELQPILEYLARQHTRGWFLLAELLEESGKLSDAGNALENYLERTTESDARVPAWQKLARLSRRLHDASGEIHALVELAQQDRLEFEELSRAANRVNGLLKEEPKAIDSDEKRILIRKLVDVMSARAHEASATDFSRLAWLCIHIKEVDAAWKYVTLGLSDEPDNEYLLRLQAKLRADGVTPNWTRI